MSEERQRFMQELDQWTEEVILKPLWAAAHEFYTENGEQEDNEKASEAVKKAVRERVFESYGAGCRATEERLGARAPKRGKEG